MTTIDSGAHAVHRHRRPVRRAGRRRAVGDDEPAGQPELADRGDAQRPSPTTLERAATDPRVRVVRLGGAGPRLLAPARASARRTRPRRRSTDPPSVLDAANRAVAVDREPAAAGGRRRAGAGRGRRRVAGAGVRRRIGFGEGVFHAGLHQDRVDARRRRVGVDRRGGRPHPRHADGVDWPSGSRPPRPTSGVWSPRCIRPTSSTPRSTR